MTDSNLPRGYALDALDYAVEMGLPLWYDGDTTVYVSDFGGTYCVVAGRFTRKVMRAGELKHQEFASTGLARNLSIHAVGMGLSCVETLIGCVIFTGSCAVVVKGAEVSVIGRVTRLIRWDGTVEGRDRILDVLFDLDGDER